MTPIASLLIIIAYLEDLGEGQLLIGVISTLNLQVPHGSMYLHSICLGLQALGPKYVLNPKP